MTLAIGDVPKKWRLLRKCLKTLRFLKLLLKGVSFIKSPDFQEKFYKNRFIVIVKPIARICNLCQQRISFNF
jgi:hypothetical protein